jgi:hypothetical protein
LTAGMLILIFLFLI